MQIMRGATRGMAALLVAFALGMFPVASFAARGTHSAPKLLNLYLGWRIEEKDQDPLARWDLVVLDMDMQWQDPERMRKLREVNPNIKILAYVSAGELAVARGFGHPTSPGYALSRVATEDMYMHDSSGKRLSWWPGAELMNVTSGWADALPAFVHDELMSTGLWDGVFLDSAYSDVTYFFGTDIDPDGDGRANPSADVNAAWRDGMSQLIRNMRATLGPDRIIMNNSSNAYASLVNGVLFENFPRFGWATPFREYRDAVTKNTKPVATSVNTNTNNAESSGDYRLMRYGMASALMSDGYYSFDAGDRGHNRTWWYDEYDVSLGDPKGAGRQIISNGNDGTGVWMREFANGIALVNSTPSSQRVALPGTYERLRGIQDPATNNGRLVRSVDLPAHDGLILLGLADATEIRNGSFVNGEFVRVYSGSGEQVRNGFFAQRNDASNGAPVVLADLARDGRESLVSARDGAVAIQAGENAETIRPFGDAYRGKLNIAVGNANGGADLEIIVAREKSRPSDVRIVSRDGRELARWQPYAASFAGGARVAIGDLDGDGQREVVTGAGPGGGPHVRVFKTDGSVWGGGFFAFNEQERGGVSVAVGDVDGDGKDEIVVGSGEGAIPRVRIFDSRGMLKREFALGSTPVLSGVQVTVANVHGDDVHEILVSGVPIF